MFVSLLFKMAPKYRAEVFVFVPKHKKVIQVLYNFSSGLCDSAVGNEFNVNEWTIFLNKVLWRKVMYWLIDENFCEQVPEGT